MLPVLAPVDTAPNSNVTFWPAYAARETVASAQLGNVSLAWVRSSIQTVAPLTMT